MILSDHIRLRPLETKDSELLFKWINNRELVIQNAAYIPVTRIDHEKWMDGVLMKRADMIFFGIEVNTTQELIGSCQLHSISAIHRSAELQIRIGNKNYQGKGFGSEAVKMLCHFGFSDLNLHRIYLNVFSSNLRAIRTYEKCGFNHEGTLKEAVFIDGKRLDVHIMALLKPN